jgi:hypothetical protein
MPRQPPPSPGARHRVVWDLQNPDLLAASLKTHRLTDRELDELADAVVRLLAASRWPPGPPGAPADQHEYGMVRFETPFGPIFGQLLTDRFVGTRRLWVLFVIVQTGGATRVARILQVVSEAAFTKDRDRLLASHAPRLPIATTFDGSLKRSPSHGSPRRPHR